MTKPNVVRVDSQEAVWHKFLSITNGLRPKQMRLSDTEMKIMSYICTQNPSSIQFSKMPLKKLLLRFPEHNKNYIGQVSFSLRKKSWITKDGYVAQHLRNVMQLYWGKPTAFTELEIAFKITTKTVEQELNEFYGSN